MVWVSEASLPREMPYGRKARHYFLRVRVGLGPLVAFFDFSTSDFDEATASKAIV